MADDNHESSHNSSSTDNHSTQHANSPLGQRLARRTLKIEEKLKKKNQTVTSLFDTDGDLSRYNIIEGSRRTRKRLVDPEPNNSNNNSRKKKPRKQSESEPPIINAHEKLYENLNSEQITQVKEKEAQLLLIQRRHDAKVKEMYHLEMYQNMLDYDPSVFVNDIRYNKYIQDYNLYNTLKSNPSVISQLHNRDLLDILSAAALQEVDIPKQQQNSTIATIQSGTGLRRHHRQFASLSDYLDSFFTTITDDEINFQTRIDLIEKEKLIRQRLAALEARGGFSTQLQQIANRRPHTHPAHDKAHHDHLIQQVQSTAKQFMAAIKYRRINARKCAKAIDRYWENISTKESRLEREEEKRLRRLARHTANQIKRKWKIVERVCEARLKEVYKERQAKEGRKHLAMILEHSEHVLNVRKKELEHGTAGAGALDSLVEHYQVSDSVLTSTNNSDLEEDNDDNEFRVTKDMEENQEDLVIEDDGESEDDDEELRELNEDANLTVEELMAKYQNMSVPDSEATTPNSILDEEQEEEEEEDNDTDFSAENNVENVDDLFIQDQESSDDNDDELNELNEDANLSVEELMKKYKYQDAMGMEEGALPSLLLDDDDDHSMTDYESSPAENDPMIMDDESSSDMLVARKSNKQQQQSTHTLIPFLLRGTLREYQHVGLDWLASLYNNGLNGILADEMGLGKTIQTISLLAYLACEKGVWGPHLIVVPTSVILNWEMELKKWLPGFKIMTYYGSPRERKEKRTGWSKENAFHVCITSYQLVLQDQNAFRRKAWQYLILDEAHHIKNFRSQRWQVLLNFNSKRRLLLTGTPLQNNLMELWSLLYFLMPNGVSQDMPIGFANLKEFQEWFSNPVDRMIEEGGVPSQQVDEASRNAIQKLHTVLRPYLLRRLKVDVEKQMPKKHEHVIYCKLSKRQRYLYDDFMSRGKTRETLASGNFLSIINCLMQLRKVCNHPDLFEERAILTSFAMTDEVQYRGRCLELLVRKRCLINKDKIDFGFLNLIITDTNNSVLSKSVAEDCVRLQATKEILKTMAKYQRKIAIAESRGVAARDYQDLKKYAKFREMQANIRTVDRLNQTIYVNQFRCQKSPYYDPSLISFLRSKQPYYFVHDPQQYLQHTESLCKAVQSYSTRIYSNIDLINQFGCITPKVVIHCKYEPNNSSALVTQLSFDSQSQLFSATNVNNDIFHPIRSRLTIAFPDKRLLQYDCGKLQKLDQLLRQLSDGGHRALIFTQMTRVLDVLETFLNMHRYRYLRLDGATKVEQRQILTEHFNNDKRILVFILSTRSGGLGINLTGADTVVFYDSDWNPSMDKQCQDRAHRIGQTRDVHIYRFVTEFTIEENIFKKANQKRMLDNVVIQEGEFTDDYFNKNEWWKDLPEVVGDNAITANSAPAPNKHIDYERALLEAEDESDAIAAIAAKKEMNMDEDEFDDDVTRQQHQRVQSETPLSRASSSFALAAMSRSQTPVLQQGESTLDHDEEDQTRYMMEEDTGDDGIQVEDVGHVDQYMLQFWEREEVGVDLGFGGIIHEEEEEE